MKKIQDQIKSFMTGLQEPKRGEMQELHKLMLGILPDGKLWFSDGTDSDGKVVTNPTIGYGSHVLTYADGKTKESFKIGLSANKAGISVYIIGIKDKKFLVAACGSKLGKASITGYCIKFKTLKDIDTGILETAVRDAAILEK